MSNMLLILSEIIEFDTPISFDKPCWYANGPKGRLHANKECWASRRVTTTIETIRNVEIKEAWTNHKICKECIDRVTLPSSDRDEMFQQAMSLSRIDDEIRHIAYPRWIRSHVNMPLLTAWRGKQIVQGIDSECVRADLDKIQVFPELQPWAERLKSTIKALVDTPIDREALDAEILRAATCEYMYYTLYVGDSKGGLVRGKMRDVFLKWCEMLRKNYTPQQATEHILATRKAQKPELANMQQNMSQWECTFTTLTTTLPPVLIGVYSKEHAPTAVTREQIQRMTSSADLEMVLCSALHRTFGAERHIVMCHPTIWKYFVATHTAEYGEMKHHSNPIQMPHPMGQNELDLILNFWEHNNPESAYHLLEDAYKATALL